MRRVAPFVLLGLAAFLLTLSALIKWYAYPHLAVVPVDQETTSVAVGADMTYFSKATLSEQTDTLTTTIRVIGNVEASAEAPDNVTVWDLSKVTQTSAGDVIAADTQRIAFDRTTGVAVDCCDTDANGEPQTYEGQVVKFPFNVQKQTYQWWDQDLKATVPFEYDGTEDIDGLTTYRFTQTIPPTMVGQLSVPSKVVGEAPGQMLDVEEWYANDRTYWIEPNTGAIVNVVEQPKTTLRYNGEDRATATAGTVTYPDDQLADNVDEYTKLGSQVHLLRVTAPLVGLIAGLVALLGGLALLALAGRREEAAGAEQAAPREKTSA